MNIEGKRQDRKIPFADVEIGDCFIYDDEYFIKIRVAGSLPNVFNLDRNKTDMCNGGTIVTPVKAKVVIE